jgi:hypothetical protein
MHSKILINESFPDPVGPDKGWEWIEIVNISNEKINLSNWEIQVGGVSYNRAFKFPEGSKIDPDEYILICENHVENCHHYTSTIAMQNGIGKTDGVRILNENAEVVNTVLYSRPNRNELKNNHEDIEIDGNIIEKPGEGYSFSRKDFSNSGFSIQDFFTTSKPTPGKENIFNGGVIISEVGFDFVEFYSAKIPTDINNWYIEDSNEEVFLKNNFKNNFFFLETTKPLKNINLYSSEDILIDTFSVENLSPNYTLCRLNSILEEKFVFCENTKGEKNELKNWEHLNLLEIIQMNTNSSYIVQACAIYKNEDLWIVSDYTAAVSVQCEHCEKDKCFTGEIVNLSKLQFLEEKELQNIKVEIANKQNYLSLFNKIIILEGDISKSNEKFSYLSTDIGLVELKEGKYSTKNEYILQGILIKNSDMTMSLEYPIILKQSQKEILPELEQTGDPLSFLFFFLILPFLLSKIFVKLATINSK